jgi:hypothetical protein
MTGLAAKASDTGKVQIVMVHKGERKASLILPAKEAGSASAIVLAAAFASYAMHKKPPPLPSAMEDTPVLQVTRIAIGEHPKPNHYTLQIQLGEAQIGFELTPAMLAPLGQALMAASAPSGRPQ